MADTYQRILLYGYFTFGCPDKQEMFAAAEAWQVDDGALGSLRLGWAPGVVVAVTVIIPSACRERYGCGALQLVSGSVGAEGSQGSPE